MNLIDILPIENWIELEKEINKRSGLNASVFNADGIRIADFKKWANRLCPVVKANESGFESHMVREFVTAATNYLTLNEISVKVKRNEKVELRKLAKI